MKHNKKASGKMSRRSFAKTVATSIIAAPIISAQPQKKSAQPQKKSTSPHIRTQHIPPIEIWSGSVRLETENAVNNHRDDGLPPGSPYKRRHVFVNDKQITFVRVFTECNQTIEAEYTNGGLIELWVRQQDIGAPRGHIAIRTPGTGQPLQVEIDNIDHSFENLSSGGTPSHPRKRRKYSDPNAKLLKARLSKPNGSADDITINSPICLIQIWAKR